MQTARQTRLEAVLQHSGSMSIEKAAFMPCVLRSLGADMACESTAAARVLHVLKGGLETGALQYTLSWGMYRHVLPKTKILGCILFRKL